MTHVLDLAPANSGTSRVNPQHLDANGDLLELDDYVLVAPHSSTAKTRNVLFRVDDLPGLGGSRRSTKIAVKAPGMSQGLVGTSRQFVKATEAQIAALGPKTSDDDGPEIGPGVPVIYSAKPGTWIVTKVDPKQVTIYPLNGGKGYRVHPSSLTTFELNVDEED